MKEDKDNESPKEKDSAAGSSTGMGIGIGVALGAAIGIMMDNLAVGLAIGIALGTVIGAATYTSKNNKNDEWIKAQYPYFLGYCALFLSNQNNMFILVKVSLLNLHYLFGFVDSIILKINLSLYIY